MRPTRYRVGIIGLTPERSWAAVAHVPALRMLHDMFEIAGVANSRRESAETAARACGIPRAFASVADLVADPGIDIVVVTVKVPHHREIVTAAVNAGKHVLCEWPLGNGLQEARDIAELVRHRGVLGVVGTQALFAPEIRHMQDLLAGGYVGEVLSTTLVGTGISWGATTQQAHAYTLERPNGATLVTIPLGHTLAALTKVLGPIAELSAMELTRRKHVRNLDTGATLPMTSPDQALIGGVLESGAALSIHYRGGTSRGPGFLWEINGTEGDLRITAPAGHAQLMPLSLFGGRGGEDSLLPLALPECYAADADDGPMIGNVRRLYTALASDLAGKARMAPSFDDAVQLHQVIEAVEQAAVSGQRLCVSKLSGRA